MIEKKEHYNPKPEKTPAQKIARAKNCIVGVFWGSITYLMLVKPVGFVAFFIYLSIGVALIFRGSLVDKLLQDWQRRKDNSRYDYDE